MHTPFWLSAIASVFRDQDFFEDFLASLELDFLLDFEDVFFFELFFSSSLAAAFAEDVALFCSLGGSLQATKNKRVKESIRDCMGDVL